MQNERGGERELMEKNKEWRIRSELEKKRSALNEGMDDASLADCKKHVLVAVSHLASQQ